MKTANDRSTSTCSGFLPSPDETPQAHLFCELEHGATPEYFGCILGGARPGSVTDQLTSTPDLSSLPSNQKSKSSPNIPFLGGK